MTLPNGNGQRMRRAFIHIGAHKTGSTSIQRFLDLSSKNPAFKFLYPKTGCFENNHIGLAQAFGFDYKSDYVAVGEAEELLSELREEISIDKDIILSSEQFSDFHLEEAVVKLWDFFILAGVEPIVIVFLRLPSDYICALYKEAIAWGETRDYDDFVAEKIVHQSPVDVAEKYFSVFGRQNVFVVEFSKKKDCLTSFCQLLGISPEASLGITSEALPRCNVSLGAGPLFVQRAINRSGVSPQVARQIYLHLWKSVYETLYCPEGVSFELNAYNMRSLANMDRAFYSFLGRLSR